MAPDRIKVFTRSTGDQAQAQTATIARLGLQRQPENKERERKQESGGTFHSPVYLKTGVKLKINDEQEKVQAFFPFYFLV
jgi:hypothetical protein